MSHMEIEYKVMISESDFIKLDDALKDKPYTLYLQTNYYYDTIKRDLKKNKLSLRITSPSLITEIKLPLSSKWILVILVIVP